MNEEVNVTYEELNNKKSNKSSKTIVIILVILIIACAGYIAYIKLIPDKKEDIPNEQIDKLEKYVHDDNYVIESFDLVLDNDFSISEKDFYTIGLKEYSVGVTMSIFGGENSNGYKKFKNGFATVNFKINNNGELVVEIIYLQDADGNSYLDKISDKKFTVSIKNEKIKYMVSDDKFIFLLTDKGNLYSSIFRTSSTNVELEEDLNNLKKKIWYDNMTDGNIKEILSYHQNDESDVSTIYLLLNDGNKINIYSKKKIEESEKYVASLRFGNARMVVNNKGNIEFCSGWEGKEKCTEDTVGGIITDENNKPIKVASMFDTENSEIFIIDSNGNIYGEKYVNTNHKVIKTLKKYNNKKVKGYTYVSKAGQRYMLKELVVDYTDGTHGYFGEISRLQIYIKKILESEEFEEPIDGDEELEQDDTSNGESYNYTSYDYEKEIRKKLLYNCTITSIKDTKIELKNPKVIVDDESDYVVESELYINGKYSRKVSYNWENTCDSFDISEIDNNHFLLRIVSESIYKDFYLFNKDGKFISDFSEWRKKYDTIWVGIDDGKFVLEHQAGFLEAMDETYCELKAKPTDISRTTEYLSIENDEIKVKDVKNTTWEEEFGECYDGSSTCVDINKIDCSYYDE